MALSLKESQAVIDLANNLYDFLPANPHPSANPALSFPGVAQKLGLQKFWQGGSKRPAVTTLLTYTLENERGHFCALILEIVKTAFIYRANKNSITREQIVTLNSAVLRIGFKIPDLWENDFLNGLPSTGNPVVNKVETAKTVDVSHLSTGFLDILKLDPQRRGFAFEKFLVDVFAAFNLSPNSPFRLVGEQIDGSLQIDSDTYLVEAKWTQSPIGQSDLLVFQGKVEGKSTWSRGLFISYSGFSEEGLHAFARGRSTNIISLTGEDIHFVLEGKIALPDLLRRKARRAAETGDFHIRAYDLLSMDRSSRGS